MFNPCVFGYHQGLAFFSAAHLCEAFVVTEQTNKSEPTLFSLVSRDIAIAAAAISVWAAADTWYLVTGIWFAQAISIVNAIFVGYVLGALFHEWGALHRSKAIWRQSSPGQTQGHILVPIQFRYG